MNAPMEDRPKPPTAQRFLLSGDNKVLEATSPEGGERFALEIAYLERFAPEIGKILNMTEIRFGVVEDPDDQVAFRFSGASDKLEGMTNSVPWSLREVASGDFWDRKGFGKGR